MKAFILSSLVLVFSTTLHAGVPVSLERALKGEGTFTKIVNGSVQRLGKNESCQIEVEGNRVRFINSESALEADFSDYRVLILRDQVVRKQTSYTYSINSINLDSEFAQTVCGVEKIAGYEQTVVVTSDTLVINDKAVCSDGQTFSRSEACLVEDSAEKSEE